MRRYVWFSTFVNKPERFPRRFRARCKREQASITQMHREEAEEVAKLKEIARKSSRNWAQWPRKSSPSAFSSDDDSVAPDGHSDPSSNDGESLSNDSNASWKVGTSNNRDSFLDGSDPASFLNNKQTNPGTYSHQIYCNKGKERGFDHTSTWDRRPTNLSLYSEFWEGLPPSSPESSETSEEESGLAYIETSDSELPIAPYD